MNDYISEGKISFNYFDSVNVTRNWTHLAEKRSLRGKITTIFRHKNILIALS